MDKVKKRAGVASYQEVKEKGHEMDKWKLLQDKNVTLKF